jgi:hypothetical protein
MMSNTDVSPEERAARGKRLLIYGMFTVVVVFVVLVFMLTWLFLAPLGLTSQAITITLVFAVVAVIACVIIWFIYTKLIAKE